MIDYMVMEAVALKVQKSEEQARKDAERDAWKKEEAQRLKREFGN